ncbi:MAG: DUF3048 C-terminal domain-containing protein [Acidimicrobiales bacterium]
MVGREPGGDRHGDPCRLGQWARRRVAQRGQRPLLPWLGPCGPAQPLRQHVRHPRRVHPRRRHAARGAVHLPQGEEASSGDATPGVTIDFGNNVLVDYVWDPARSCFARYQVDYNHPRGSSAFVDSTGTQACPANVVVMNIEYGISSADANSPEAVTVGQGDGLVLSDGKAVPIRWKRDLPISVPTITDAAGNPVGLTPGKTWVALPEAADAPIHPMDAGTAQSLLAGVERGADRRVGARPAFPVAGVARCPL